jgi:hypothetical protein
MYADVSHDCADCEEKTRVFPKTEKAAPGTYKTGTMVVSINPGFWMPSDIQTQIDAQQKEIEALQKQIKGLKN